MDLTGLRTQVSEGRYREAADGARTLLAATEARSGSESIAVAEVLDVLVESLWRGGRAAEAETVRLAERAVAIKRRKLGSAHAATGTSLASLGVVLLVGGKPAEARPALEAALLTRERALPADDPAIAASLGALGACLQTLGDSTGARARYERALSIQERSLGAAHVDTAKTANNLATLLVSLGDYPEADALYQRALGTLERELGEGHPLLAQGWHNQAELAARMGETARARALYERALAVKRASLGPAHPSIALTLNNLALLHLAGGELAAARRLLEEAARIAEAALGAGHATLALVLNNLGRVLTLQGELGPARATLERALVIRERVGGADHPEVAFSLENLAALELATGDPAAAEALAGRALAIRRDALGADHPLVADATARLAWIETRRGRAAAGARGGIAAETIGRSHLRWVARALPERQALAFAAERLSGLDVALAAAAGSAVPADALWDAVIRSRAVVTDELSARHRGASGGAAERAYRSAAGRYAALLVAGPGSAGPAAHRERVAAARAELEHAEAELARASSEFRQSRAESELGLDEVLRALPAGTALVAYARAAAPPAFLPGGETLPVGYLALIGVAGRGEVAAVPLGEAAAIESLVRRWRAQVVAEPARPDAESAARIAGERLRRAIWDPIVPRLAGARRVFLVPAGALHLVSFGALPSPRAGRFLVDEGPVLHLLSAERQVAALASGARIAGRGLVAVGAPALPAPSAGSSNGGRVVLDPCTALRERRFPALPGAAREVREIAQLWRRVRPAEPVLELELPSERELARRVRGSAIVHLATHAVILDGGCAAPEGEAPLRLGGVVLSTAALPAGEGDGLLTTFEIVGLDLEGVDWAVLSGCDTGAGEILPGEGVLGLARAFRMAGARTLIMSLWSVPDEGARRWMLALYRARLERRLGTAEAVAAASRAVLAERRARGESTHPFYWGGFVATGDWH